MSYYNDDSALAINAPSHAYTLKLEIQAAINHNLPHFFNLYRSSTPSFV